MDGLGFRNAGIFREMVVRFLRKNLILLAVLPVYAFNSE